MSKCECVVSSYEMKRIIYSKKTYLKKSPNTPSNSPTLPPSPHTSSKEAGRDLLWIRHRLAVLHGRLALGQHGLALVLVCYARLIDALTDNARAPVCGEGGGVALGAPTAIYGKQCGILRGGGRFFDFALSIEDGGRGRGGVGRHHHGETLPLLARWLCDFDIFDGLEEVLFVRFDVLFFLAEEVLWRGRVGGGRRWDVIVRECL